MDGFDDKKDEKNRRRRGLSLARFDDMVDAIVEFDAEHSEKEDRYKVIGRIDGIGSVASVTYRNQQARVISLRRATPRERKDYEDSW